MPPEAAAAGEGNRGRPRLKRVPAWGAVTALLAVTGIAVTLFAATPLLRPADSDEGTLRGLQIRVLNISQAAAENRMDGALTALEALEKDLNDAAGQGRISLSRYRGIEAAVEAVRADINGQVAAVSAAAAEIPVAAPAETPAPVALPEPQPEPAQPVVVPLPAPAPVQEAPALQGPAKEAKDKGKGKGQEKQ